MKLIFHLVGHVTLTSVMTLTFFSVGLTLNIFRGVHSIIIPNFILLTKIAQLFHQEPPLYLEHNDPLLKWYTVHTEACKHPKLNHGLNS